MTEAVSDELFRVALEASPTGMIVVDEQGAIVLVNAQLERLFGYERRELIGQSIEIFLPERFRGRHPDLRAGFFAEPSARPMGEGRDLFGRHKDGSEISIEIGLSPLSIAGRRFVLASVADIRARNALQAERQALEAQLARAEAEQTFRESFDQSPIATAILEHDLRYSHVNAAWVRLLGFERRELLGKTPVDITHPEDRAEDQPLLLALTSGEIRAYSREKRYLRRDGSIVHVLVHAAAAYDASGARYYIGQIQDITERIRSEQTLRALQAELSRQLEVSSTVLSNMPRGAVFLIDRNLCYLSASGPSVVDLLGVQPEELPGRSAEQMIPAEYRDDVLQHLHATLDGKRVEFEAVRGERTFEVRTAPIFSGEPFPVAALIHLYDVTERKRQAQALEIERERFRTLVANAPVGIFEIDAGGNVTYMNDRWLEITGLSVEDARSPWLRTRAVHPDDRVKLVQTWSEASRDGTGYRMDFRYQVEGGKPQRLSSVAAPLRLANGAVSGFIGITLDVTAQLEASEAVERSLREKETLLKEIHHRVKNNLQVVGSIIGLQASRSQDEQVRSVFEDVRGRIQAIALLHERLYRSPDLGAINLLEYLHGLVGDAARASGAGPDRTTVRGPEAPILLGMDDAVPVGLVANELVTNAFKHGSRGSQKARIVVELSLIDDVLSVSVADDGPGFPANFRPEEAKTLGLLLLRSLAKQLKGEMLFSSSPPRAMLRFSMRARREE